MAGLDRIGEATPHTRGSTLMISNTPSTKSGYPAYAGIDPKPLPIHRSPMRLPRIRGDRPFGVSKAEARRMATPHTRGSTPFKASFRMSFIGYPAYAGIDPIITLHVRAAVRLPRIRGDRPAVSPFNLAHTAATPHTRGSTAYIPILAPDRPGYPAYAGIDLQGTACCGSQRGLPRIRGDRP